MLTNADLIPQLKNALNPEILLLEKLRDELLSQERGLEEARERVRFQQERVERFVTILKAAQESAS